MALTITKRCNRCRQPMRNDGTEQNPHWVCNNPKCVKYVPPAPDDNGEEDTDGKTVEYVPDKTEDNGEEDTDGKTVEYVPDKTEDNGEEDSEDSEEA